MTRLHIEEFCLQYFGHGSWRII